MSRYSMLNRRQFAAGIAALTASAGMARFVSAQSTDGAVTATDVVGRSITLERPAERIIVTSRSGFYTLALLDQGAGLERLVGWNSDLRTTDKDSYTQYIAAFPALADLPVVGNVGAADFNAELVLDLEPDLVVVDLGAFNGAKENGLVDTLEAAGIQLVVVDYREYMLENTMPSVQVLGRLTGHIDSALAFSDFYLQETNKVYDRIATLDPALPKPSMFIQRAPGIADVGLTFGNGNFGAFIPRAGGVNWAEQYVGGVHGTVNPEQILVGDFEQLVMTGANWSDSATVDPGHFISLGYEADPAAVQAAINTVIADNTWETLPAVEAGKVYTLWHQFYISPYSFIAFQQFAKWLHPDLFEDVDPSANFQLLHEQFLPIEYKGVFFADWEQN